MPADRPTLARSGNVHWAIFDPTFYARHNPGAAGIDDPNLLLDHYLRQGSEFSPNPWFDEAFYRARNPDVVELIRNGDVTCGFEHYGQVGYIDRAPHWLFDPLYYTKSNPDLTQEVLEAADFVNSYDHYLKYGAREGRRAHPFFDPQTYLEHLPPDEIGVCREIGAFAHFLTKDWGDASEPIASEFDPVAYCSAHPDRAGRWHSALHHFLAHCDRLPPPETAGPVPHIKINIDRPQLRDGEAVEPINLSLDIVGWAASNHPIAAVEIFVGDQAVGRAHHGIRTDGVAAAFPEFVHAQFAGLRFIAASQIPPGRHLVRVVARDATGLEVTEAFTAEFQPQLEREGPWSLRRRMRQAEADFKLNLLENTGFAPEFVVVLRDTGDNDAASRTQARLQRQVYPRWQLSQTPPDGSDVWLIQLTPGDEPGVDALLELALHLRLHPQADLIYSDERRVDPATGIVGPFFKPDWSPELLLSTNYIGRLWAARIDLLRRAGIEPDHLAAIGAFDAVLRLTERASEIAHVPKVLCESANLPFTDLADEESVLQRALDRRGLAASVEPGRLPYSWRVRPDHAPTPLVSVIIPTAGAGDLISIVLSGLHTGTAHPNLEIIVVDTRPGVVAPWKAGLAMADRVIEDDQPFNWSRINNRAAAVARGELLLFLNDDVAFTDPGWLHALIEPLQHKGVGIVGPQLLYPAGMVQHAGMFLSRTGGAHAFYGLANAAPGPFGLALTLRNVSSVTGACMLVRRTVFDRLGGFDAQFRITYNDVDFCLRAVDAGARVVFTPHCVLTHRESASRAGLPETDDATQFSKRWSERLAGGDPYFNPNLSLSHTDYRPEPEPVEIIYPARPLARPDSIRRILVIKLDHIGDFILSLPAIRRLKQHFPASRLTLLAAPGVCELAKLEPGIDNFIDFEFFHPRSAMGLMELDAGALDDLASRLLAEAFDLAIDLRCNRETRPILEVSGATWRAGFDAGYAFPWLDIVGVMEPDMQVGRKRMHAADTLLDFVKKIAESFAVTWIPARSSVTRVLSSEFLDPPPGTRTRIAVHPGAGNTTKQWPATSYVTVINRLIQDYDACVILVGGTDDMQAAAYILSALAPTDAVISTVGLTSPKALADVIESCDIFIGNDSGPHHLAAHLGVLTIGIHSGVVDSHEWAPLGPRALALSKRVVCGPCYLAKADDCPRSLFCLNEITPGDVMSTLNQIVPRNTISREVKKDSTYSTGWS